MLNVRGVSKSYHGVPAVQRVSIDAKPGDIIGLLGPNGSGKSTTVKMMVGLVTPSSGSIRWRDKEISDDLLAYQAVIGYVPEEPHLYGYLTAPEYLELVGGLRHLTASVLARRISRYLDLFGLTSDRFTPLSSFSKGMRQKVLISAALLHDPELIVFDEPCSGLDVSSTLVLRSLVKTLAGRGKTIVYSSHVLDIVEKLCEHVLILHHGEVVAQDSVTRLRDLARVNSLEEVFAALAVDQDVDAIGAELAGVASS
jgi:ABC-2 type transport system ATP-binding protein